jgi:hypothetical protein
MKKKFRKIVIDGDDSWAWGYNIPMYRGCEESFRHLAIWKDKKAVFRKTYGRADLYYQEPKNYKITPGLISRFIKRYLRK